MRRPAAEVGNEADTARVMLRLRVVQPAPGRQPGVEHRLSAGRYARGAPLLLRIHSCVQHSIPGPLPRRERTEKRPNTPLTPSRSSECVDRAVSRYERRTTVGRLRGRFSTAPGRPVPAFRPSLAGGPTRCPTLGTQYSRLAAALVALRKRRLSSGPPMVPPRSGGTGATCCAPTAYPPAPVSRCGRRR